MGSWSVYCSISQIAITAGQKCVLLPLKTSGLGERTYLPHLPATLPIFGEYDDYGGIENIEKDENTNLIEQHFGVTIEEFATYFTRGIIRDDEDDFPVQLKEVEELKDWQFMFIDRKVYDFMSTHLDDDAKGYLRFGKPAILKLLGFKDLGEQPDNPTNNPNRYRYAWEFDGKTFHSDGTWLHYGNQGIYNFSGLQQHVEIPHDKLWVGQKAMWQLWAHFDKGDPEKTLLSIIGLEADTIAYRKLAKFFLDKPQPEPTALVDKYAERIPDFGDSMAELMTIRHNLHSMSGCFNPFIPYLTPQCGERTHHQVLLDKFAEIHREMIDEDDE